MSSDINTEILQVSESLENATISNDEDTEILKSIEDSLQNKDEENVDDKTDATLPKKTETDLLEIVNSMEADRKKFIEHVRSKICNQEKEFKVYHPYYHRMFSDFFVDILDN